MHIYFCTTPKAGSQWFRDLMNNHLLQPHVRWRHREHQWRELSLYADHWPDSEDEDLFYGPLYGTTPSLAARHVRPEDRVIGLFRDPRDVAVSWMYSALYSHSLTPTIALMRPVLTALPEVERLRIAMYFAYDFCAAQGLWFRDLPDRTQSVAFYYLFCHTFQPKRVFVLFP